MPVQRERSKLDGAEVEQLRVVDPVVLEFRHEAYARKSQPFGSPSNMKNFSPAALSTPQIV